jgi:hypothetical protein
MSNIKIRNLDGASDPQIVSGNYIPVALNTDEGQPQLTKKATFGQVVSGGITGYEGNIYSGNFTGLSVTGCDTLHECMIGANSDLELQNGMIHISAGAVTSDTLAPGAVTSTALAPGAVDSTALAPGAVDGSTLPISPGGGLEFDENGNLRVATTAESFNFVLYVNKDDGIHYNDIDSSDSQGFSIFTELNDRFITFSDAVNWIMNNIGSSRGRSCIVLETDCTSAPLHTPSYIQEIEVWGNKSTFTKYYNESADDPTNIETRKTIEVSSSGLFNNIPIWLESNFKFFLVKLKIESDNSTSSLFRCLGSMVDLIGVRVIHEANGSNPNSAIESVDKGFIRIRPFVAKWRTGLDKQDPFSRGKKLAALELENIEVTRMLSMSSGSRMSIIEYNYRAYDSNQDYTWNARIHLVNAPTSTTVLYIENFSEFHSNGAGFTCSAGVSYSPSIIFNAKIFNSINAGLTQVVDTPSNNGVQSNYPAGNIIGTLNVDYAIGTAFTTGPLYEIDSYDA